MVRQRSLGDVPSARVAAPAENASAFATERPMTIEKTIPEPYRVDPPVVPQEDLSGPIGERLLNLLGIHAERNLRWLEEERALAGITDGFVLNDPSRRGIVPVHLLYQAASAAYEFAVLARFSPEKQRAGVLPETLVRDAVALVEAMVQSHKVAAGERASRGWTKFSALRLDYLLGMGAWLVWEWLTPQTRLLLARILEHDADLWSEGRAPARLYEDTQGESNAWSGGGMALAYCMLKAHPRREVWGEKAKELMISAYATEEDVHSERVVDGKPLREWLTGPNAFPDLTVENHGFVHPDYMAAVSEMVRSALCYHLAGEPVPEAATFNAERVLDMLLLLNLPDGNHLYVQGSDYIARRVDSFFQACSVVPLKPSPLRNAAFLRALDSLEKIATERPDLPMSGWLRLDLLRYDFGSGWGLTENYLMRRFFGTGGSALPLADVPAQLAGVHISEGAKFVLHRTPRTISSFSWHTSARASQVMGLTMPLDRDVLCSPLPVGSYIGDIRESPTAAPGLQVLSHHVQARADGFEAMVELLLCSGKVRQSSAFVSLPDGMSVYLEERTAVSPVEIVRAESGNVSIYDDMRWVYQKAPRKFFAPGGPVEPSPARIHSGNWLNVDNRMGYVALGLHSFRLERFEPPNQYRTCRLAFVHTSHPREENASLHFTPGERISTFALVSCPNLTKEETALLAESITRAGWLANERGVLAIQVGAHIVHANFASHPQRLVLHGSAPDLPPMTPLQHW